MAACDCEYGAARKGSPTIQDAKQVAYKDTITMGEPVMTNPNSYRRVQEVLESISSNRCPNHTWSMVGCDGVPYVMAQKLRDEHPLFQDILLCPGQGHFEINLVKLLFRYLWPVGLETLASMLGFNSPKALSFAYQATNHHKSWEILHLYFQSVVRHQLNHYAQTTPSPTATEFFHWVSQQPNATYRYINHMVFWYLSALFMFRQGVREGNSSLLLGGGGFILGELFYTGNSRIYMEVNFRDIITRLKAPTEYFKPCKEMNPFPNQAT